MVGVGSFGAHATSVVVKRVVRRRRPDHPSVAVVTSPQRYADVIEAVRAVVAADRELAG